MRDKSGIIYLFVTELIILNLCGDHAFYLNNPSIEQRDNIYCIKCAKIIEPPENIKNIKNIISYWFWITILKKIEFIIIYITTNHKSIY